MIIIPAILEGFRSLKDRSYKIYFETGELTPEQAAGISTSLQQAGYVAFKTDVFKDSEKKMLDSLEADFEDKRKTPGQRLRGVLYRMFENNSEGYKDFNLFYQGKMEILIDHFKKKLDEIRDGG